MVVWTVSLSLVGYEYYILGVLYLIVGIWGTLKHVKPLPILWGAIMAITIIGFGTSLEPLIFGYQYYPLWSIGYIAVSIFGILFLIDFIQSCYNVIDDGEVVR